MREIEYELTASASNKAGAAISVDVDQLNIKATCDNQFVVAVYAPETGSARKETFNVSDQPSASDELAELIERLLPGETVLLVTSGRLKKLPLRAARALETVGSTRAFDIEDGKAWALIGRKGAASGSVPEALSETSVHLTHKEAVERRTIRKSFHVEVSAKDHATRIAINGEMKCLSYPGGLAVAELDETDGRLIRDKVFDGLAGFGLDATAFASTIDAISDGRVVALAYWPHDWEDNISSGDLAAIVKAGKSVGSNAVEQFEAGASWSLIGVKGSLEPAVEMINVKGDVVSRRWFVPNMAIDVSATSRGFFDERERWAAFSLNGKEILRVSGPEKRGIAAVVVNEMDGEVVATRIFDTWACSEEALSFANFIESVATGYLVALAVCDEGSRYAIGCAADASVRAKVVAACESLGSTKVADIQYRNSWALIGRKGSPPGDSVEVVSDSGPAVARFRTSPINLLEQRNFLSAASGKNRAEYVVDATTNGLPLLDRQERSGLNIVVLDESGCFVRTQGAYELSCEEEVRALIAFVNAIPPGSLCLVTMKGPAQLLTDCVRDALQCLGSGLAHRLKPTQPYALIGIKGAAPGSMLELVGDGGAVALGYTLPYGIEGALSPIRDIRIGLVDGSSGVAGVTIDGILVASIDSGPGVVQAILCDRSGLVIDNAAIDMSGSDRWESLSAFCKRMQAGQLVILSMAEQADGQVVLNVPLKLFSGRQPAWPSESDWPTHPWTVVASFENGCLCQAFGTQRNPETKAVVRVPLLTKKKLPESTIEVSSAEGVASIRINGEERLCNERGWGYVADLGSYGDKFDAPGFFMSNELGVRAFCMRIQEIPSGNFVAVAASDYFYFDDEALRAFRSIGSSIGMLGDMMRGKRSWALVGFKGAPPGMASECIGKGAVTVSVTLPLLGD